MFYLRPYPNEHSARLRNPDDFDSKTFRRTEGGSLYGKIKVPKTIAIIWGKLKGKAKPSDPPIPQALRFPTKNWTADEAKKWLKTNNIKYEKFEPASQKEKTKADATYNCECIECGYQMESDKHCKDLKCPKCGGRMRRVDRPGPGQKEDDYISHRDIPIATQTDLTIRHYQTRFDTLNEEDRTVEAILSTEDRVAVLDWIGFRVVEEILLMEGFQGKTEQVPLVDSHDRSSVQKQYGSVRNIRVEDNRLIGTKHFSSSPVADHPWQLTKEKHLTDNSIGYRILNSAIIEKGQETEVAGRKFKASSKRDLRVVTDWELKEVSVVAVGADSKAKNRKEAPLNGDNKSLSNQNERIGKMEKFKLWLLERGLNYDDLDEQQREALQADFETEQKRKETETVKDQLTGQSDGDKGQRAETTAIDAAKVANEAIETERQRVAAIRELASDDVPVDVVEQCIREGTSQQDAQGIFLKAIRESRPKIAGLPAIHITDGQPSREALADGLLLRAGYDDVFQADEKQGDQRAETARKFRDISLLDVCRHALFLDGENIPTSRVELVRRAFSMATLPVLLSSVVNKSLLKGYQLAPESWRKWCGIGSAPDYKDIKRVRLTDMGEIPELPDGGEVKYGSLEEDAETYRIYDYAQNIGISNQTIANDDLNAITKVPVNRGVKAKQRIGDLVYTHLLANGAMADAIALFHASHSNLITSNGLAKATLEKALYTFQKQTDKDGKTINIIPKVLLVPPELKYAAKELVKSITIVVAGSTDTVRGSYNPIADDDLQVVSEARLSNASYSGYSTTNWYMSADPNLADTIEVSFLNGVQEPKLETFNAGPDRIGLIWRILISFGCKAVDWRGMQKSTA